MTTKRQIINAFSSQKHRVRFVPEGETMTKQHHKNECDINKIMDKFQKTGATSHVSTHEAKYYENTDLDYQTAVNIVTDSQRMFNDLPSSLRNKFQNDPAKFLRFVQNPENEAELIKLGLAHEREQPGQVKETLPITETNEEEKP